MATSNYATSIAPKAATAIREQSPPAPWFSHAVPAKPAGLTEPVFPGTLTGKEREEVSKWLAASQTERPSVLGRLTQRAAIAKVAEYMTYYADPKYIAWQASSQLDRIAQWRDAVGSASAANTDAVPPVLVSTGIGVPRSGDVLPPGEDEPDVCEEPTHAVDSGIIGSGTVVISLTCVTGGATIHININGGSWANYIAPVSVDLGDTLYWYGSAPGLADSATNSLENA